jgi:hypothetical protein
MSNPRKYLWIPIVIAVSLFQSQGKSISDSIKLAKYQAPPQIAQLAQATKMTDKGRRLFYLTNPQVKPKTEGLQACRSAGSSDQTNTLGCYIPAKGIFILEVNDQRLQGVMETTAAHEMLHVAYQELSIEEQNILNQQLQKSFDQLKDQKLQDILDIYKQHDPSSILGELHSRLGTQYADLSPELEKHYRNYFSDRSTVVALSKNYGQAFAQLETKANKIERQLLALKANIERLEAQAKEQRAALNTPPASADQRDEYNRRVDTYNQFIREINQQSQAYNQMLRSYKALSAEEKSLNNALTSGSP